MSKHSTSRYTILIPLENGRSLAYNAMSGALALWSAEETTFHERFRGGGEAEEGERASLAQFERGGYLLPDHLDELAALRRMYEVQRYRQDVMTLTVAPTMACNFGCDYCFQGQDKPGDTMSVEVQDAIVGLIEKAAPGLKSLGIGWYGGEPLLRLHVIEAISDRILEICARRGLSYEAMVVTNGFLLDGAAARSLAARKVKTVQVTLDGVPEHHDARRHLLSKKGTFSRIAQNLREVVDAAPDLGLSIRVNIDDRNADEIHRLLDLLGELGLGHRNNLKVYFAPVEAMTEGCHEIQEACLSKSAYGQLEAELHRHGFELGLTSLPYPPRFHGTCAAIKPKGFVILPSGDVHKCWDTVSSPDKKVGTIFDIAGLVKSEMAMRWLRWTPFDNETCRNCKLLPSCAGACAYKFIHADDTRGEAAVLPCPSWKYNIKERLLHRAERMGFIEPGDHDPATARTDPAELCADVHVGGGRALPEAMQREYEAQKKPARKRRLPLAPAPEEGMFADGAE
jgi:uncharacterized protein